MNRRGAGYPEGMRTWHDTHPGHRAVPTEQSDTPVDETPDGDGVHFDEQPVEMDAHAPAPS